MLTQAERQGGDSSFPRYNDLGPRHQDRLCNRTDRYASVARRRRLTNTALGCKSISWKSGVRQNNLRPQPASSPPIWGTGALTHTGSGTYLTCAVGAHFAGAQGGQHRGEDIIRRLLAPDPERHRLHGADSQKSRATSTWTRITPPASITDIVWG